MDEGPAIRLKIKFKGSRTYLHGTDLFDTLIELAGVSPDMGCSYVRMSFYRPITSSVEAVRWSPDGGADFRPAALLELQVNGRPVNWAIRERPDEIVDGRRPYDENLVTAGAVLEGRRISQKPGTEYTFVERAVALNKRLLDHLRRDLKISWWFARLELQKLPPPSPALDLMVETELGGRLVKSSIDIDGKRAGAIYFSEKAA